MSLFRRKEKRSDTGTVEVDSALLTAMLSGSSIVTKEQALQIPTVAACITLIADRIAALPVKLFREKGKKVDEITDDPRLDLLNHDTGDTLNASEMKKLWVRDYFLGKGSYTYISRNMFNEPTGLFYVDERRVAVVPNADPIHKNYSLNVNGHIYFPFQFLKILRNTKGFGTGVSIIDENPLMLAIYYNTMNFENANIRKGGNKRGFLKARSTVGREEMDVLKDAWRQLYSNSNDNADNIVVLNGGVDFQEASSTSVELQLNENKKTNAEEICKLFCMPADVLNGKATDAVMSQFVQNCLTPPINTIEAALDHDLLTEAEKKDHYYFAFDTSELTRGDFASRMNGYATALQNNIYQLDEIREKEDLPPLGFNYIRLGLDTVLLDPDTGEIYTPNTDKTATMSGNSGLTNEEERGILELRERQAIFGDGHKIVGNISVGGSGGGGSGSTATSENDSNNGYHSIGGNSKSNYSPFNYEASVTQEVREAFEEECKIAESKFGKISTIKGVRILNDRSSDEGAYSDNSELVYLRHAEKKNALSTMTQIASHQHKSGEWSTGHPRHTMRHEIGHAIQKEHKNNDNSWNDKLTKINHIFEMASKNIDGHKMPSKYASQKPSEFISECIAASYKKSPGKTVNAVINIIIGGE